MEKSRKYATLCCVSAAWRLEDKEPRNSHTRTYRIFFALCLWNNQGITMQTKFLRHSTELGNLAHCLYKSTLEIGKVGL